MGDPHWSPDGRSVAFTPHRPETRISSRCDAIRKTRAATAASTYDGDRNRRDSTWSHDGRWIYFSSSRSGDYEVWRMPADGSAEPQRITWNGGYLARESADGKWLYYSSFGVDRFWRIALPSRGPGQTETPVALNVPFKAGATWALGTRELFYYPSIEDPSVHDFFGASRRSGNGPTRELPVGNVRLGRGLPLSPDERWLLRSRTIGVDAHNDRQVDQVRAAAPITGTIRRAAKSIAQRANLDPLTIMQPDMDAAVVTVLLKELQEEN